MPEEINMPAEDHINRIQECQDLLLEIRQMSKQREEHIRLLAMCDGIAEERQRILISGHEKYSSAASKSTRSTQTKLENHKDLVTRHLKTIDKLQLAQRELILDLLMDALDTDRYQFRRRMVISALQLANDVHQRIKQKSMVLSSLVRESHELSTQASCCTAFEAVRSIEQES